MKHRQGNELNAFKYTLRVDISIRLHNIAMIVGEAVSMVEC
jgi:hypothetical protein